MELETTKIADDMHVPVQVLEALCERYDRRSMEFACFMLHSSRGSAELAIHRVLDGMFEDENVQAVQEETAQCVRAVALAAYDYKLSQLIETEAAKARAAAQPG